MNKIKSILIGSISTAIMLTAMTRDWRVGVAFFGAYIVISFFERLWILSLTSYLGAWGYFWWEYTGEISRLITREDSVMVALNLIPVSLLVLLFISLMLAGFPTRGRRATESKSLDSFQSPYTEVLGPEHSPNPLKVELTIVTKTV